MSDFAVKGLQATMTLADGVVSIRPRFGAALTGTTTVPVGAIARIEVKPARWYQRGRVRIIPTHGAATPQGAMEAANDPYSMFFKPSQASEVEAFLAAVRREIGASP